MGASISKATINNAINTAISQTTTAMQNACGGPITSGNLVSQVGCTGFTQSHITQTSLLTESCSANDTSSVEQSATQNVSATLQNAAQSLNSGILTGTIAVADAVTQNLENLSAQINSQITQTCAMSALSSTNGVTCTNSTGGSQTYIDQASLINAIFTCAFNATSVQTAVQTATANISNSATAEQQGLFGGIIGLVVIIVIAFVIYLIFRSKSSTPAATGGAAAATTTPPATTSRAKAILTSPWLWIAIVLVVSIVMVVFYFLNFWPYKSVEPTNTSTVNEANKSTNLKIFLPFLCISGLCLLIIIIRIGYGIMKP